MKKIISRSISAIFIATITISFVFFLSFLIYIIKFSNYKIPDEALTQSKSTITKVYTMNFSDRSQRLGTPSELPYEELYATKRIWTPIETLPENLINAFVAIEDRRFFEHDGVDYLRTGKAVLNHFFKFSARNFGGSSITQQLVKNLTGKNEIKIKRKIHEIFAALDLEKRMTKHDILELYLNIIYLSENSYGVGAASEVYFEKSVSDLTLTEACALAAIVQNPCRYDPYLAPASNQARRRIILNEMLEQGMITPEEYETCYKEELVLSDSVIENRNTDIYSWYTEAVIDDVISDLMRKYGYSYEKASYMVFSGGLKIYALIDENVQSIIDQVYSELSVPNDLESAFVVIDPTTGDVLGIRGSVKEKHANLVLNRATETLRPPGSTIKPLSVYAPALDRGLITYGSVYDDIPTEQKRNKAWPQNATRSYSGLTSINNAIVCSLNTIPVQLLKKLGTRTSFEFLKNKLKITGLTENTKTKTGQTLTDNALAPMALGQLSFGITLRELTAAYSIFPSGGQMSVSKTYYRVLDADGNILLEADDTKEQVIGRDTASIMTRMLKNVVDYGTAKRITAKRSLSVAGKTGTSGEDYDKWLIAFTPYYVGGVWIGYDTPRSVDQSMAYLTCRIWDRVMLRLHKSIPNASKGFPLADNVIKVKYCCDSGCLPTKACELDPRGCRIEVGYFTRSTAPKARCTRHRLVEINGETGDLATIATNPLLKRTISLLDYQRAVSGIQVADYPYLIGSRKADLGEVITDPDENFEYEDE